MKSIRVVCGIIFQDGKVLIARRKPEKKLGGYWEFPGGKVEPHETDQMSLVRELAEELGMHVVVGDHFLTSHHDYDDFTIELTSYLCRFLEANFNMTDHDAYEWVLIEDLPNWPLAPADIPIAKSIVTKYNPSPERPLHFSV